MTRRWFLLAAGCALVGCLAGLALVPRVRAVPDTLPARLTDQEFWTILSDFSEPDGSFRSDNLLSNEAWLQYVIPDLIKIAKPDRVYLGVGPEQNFTYIAALRPRMAFIVDLRRGNLDLHLIYKALFELSADRGEFVSRLFSRKRPAGLGPRSTVQEIFAAYSKPNVETSESRYKENLKAIQDHLVRKHGFAVPRDDLQRIEYIYRAFFSFGPAIQYSSTGSWGGRYQPSYADLMVATDANGQARSYLATEERFAFLKDLQTKNLLVPVVGNFAGPKAIGAIGKYLKQKRARVSAFYLSNVEQYLSQDGLWWDFCRNVATLPLDETSTFIRAVRRGQWQYGRGVGLSPQLGAMAAEVKECGVT